MASNEQLQQELIQTKAHAFDVLVEAQNLKTTFQKQQHILFVLAHKLGWQDMNSLDMDALPAMLDEKLQALSSLENQLNQRTNNND